MSKLILFASLLLICKISSAQLPNDKNQLIIASYTAILKGVKDKDSGNLTQSITIQRMKEVTGIECDNPNFEVLSFAVAANLSSANFTYRHMACIGASFKSEVYTFIINNLKPGDYLFIDDVRVKAKSGQVFGIKPKAYRITIN